eukprot:SAG22_NODE_1086_length_5629_cov_2.137251_4_plen_540_part_00
MSRLSDFPAGGPLVGGKGPKAPGAHWAPGERHGPYAKGCSSDSRSVNGVNQAPKPVNPSINASAQPLAQIQPAYPTGLGLPGYFVSETGATTMSSFESMSATLSEANWGLHSAPMFERNYSWDRWVFEYFRLIDLNVTGAGSFQRQLYFCMFGQALYMKAQIESWRATNIMGMLLWQYNEVWPTGGWGSVEYGTPVEGQVSGGRWKPLQHFLAASSFTDVTASCGASQTFHTIGLVCYARNDLPTAQSVRVTVELLHFATGAADVVSATDIDLAAGAGTTVFFCADGRGLTAPIKMGSTATAPCAPFDGILNATACTATTCMLNVTVVGATFPPVGPPPFPPPPPPPPPPPTPCPGFKSKVACPLKRCQWNATSGCVVPPPAPPKPAPPAPPPSKDCTFTANTDFHDGGMGGGARSQTQSACCGLCAAHPKCVAAVWLMNGEIPQCYLKAGATTPYTRAGRYACVPKTNTSATASADARAQQALVTGRVFARNLLPLTAPGRFELPSASVTAAVSDDGAIKLTATATAVYGECGTKSSM